MGAKSSIMSSLCTGTGAFGVVCFQHETIKRVCSGSMIRSHSSYMRPRYRWRRPQYTCHPQFLRCTHGHSYEGTPAYDRSVP